MIELPQGVNAGDDRPVEQRYRSAVAGLARRIRLLYDGVVARFGDEGLDLIRSTSRAYGEEIALRARDVVEPGDVRSIGAFIVRVFNTIGGDGEVAEFSDRRVVIRVRRCPYLFDQPRLCQAHTEMEKALVESLGQDVRYTIERSIPSGDPYCDHVIERRRA